MALGQMTAKPGFEHDAGELDRPSPNHMDAGSWGTVAYAGSNANGPREVQEDRWVAVPRLLEPTAPNVLLIAVFDGHGGPAVAERCEGAVKEITLRALQNQRAAQQQADLAPAQIQAALEEAFSQLSALCPDRGMGTTATLLLVTDNLIGVGHVGDSRAILLGSRGPPLVLTPDHKGSNALEAARIRDLGGRLDKEGYVEGSLGVTRALGDRELHPYVSDQPEITVIPRTPSQHVLIVASDGLWDVIDELEAVMLTETGMHHLPDDEHTIPVAPSVRASEALMQAALKAGTQDNITVAVVDLQVDRPRIQRARRGTPSAPRTAAAGGAAEVQQGETLTMSRMRQVHRQEQHQQQDQAALATQRLSQWLDEAAQHHGMS